eukprot:5866451-Amphidinium_carterae.1
MTNDGAQEMIYALSCDAESTVFSKACPDCPGWQPSSVFTTEQVVCDAKPIYPAAHPQTLTVSLHLHTARIEHTMNAKLDSKWVEPLRIVGHVVGKLREWPTQLVACCVQLSIPILGSNTSTTRLAAKIVDSHDQHPNVQWHCAAQH